MKLTRSIDEKLIADARRVAAQRGTTLDQLVRDYLAKLTRVGDTESVIEQLDGLWESGGGRSNLGLRRTA